MHQKTTMEKGESFSPTDLVAASLAACMVTVINISDLNGVFGIETCSAEVEKNNATNSQENF